MKTQTIANKIKAKSTTIPDLILDSLNSDVFPGWQFVAQEKIPVRIVSYSLIKRCIDLIISIFGLLLTAPLFLFIAILIKIDSRGPVFFKQTRCGKDGKEFTLYKFRTMIVDAEKYKKRLKSKNEMQGPIFKIKNDPRVTRTGKWLRKFSLDELPQLINVLKGEMSLVGPRPLNREELRGNLAWKNLRLTVKPGITGPWQVNIRSLGTFEDMVNWDLYYVKNKSILLDVQILLKTPGVVLSGKGAY